MILTSSDAERAIADGFAGGADGYVRKPVDCQDFAEVIKRVELYWALTNVCHPS